MPLSSRSMSTAAVAAIIVAAFGVSSAHAQEASRGPWEGFYFGVTGGYATGEAEVDGMLRQDRTNGVAPLVSEDGKADLDGGMVGGLVGFDYNLGNGIVIGGLADLSWTGLSGEADVEPDVILGPTDYSVDTSVGWLGTVRGRIGVELGDALIYGTGGVAFGGVDADLNVVGDGGVASDSGTQIGWTAGAGVSFMVTDNLMLGAEYLYVDLGEQSYDFGNSGEADVGIDMHVIRGSFSFRF